LARRPQVSTISAISLRDGAVRWQHTVPYRLSAPAVSGGLYLVPKVIE